MIGAKNMKNTKPQEFQRLNVSLTGLNNNVAQYCAASRALEEHGYGDESLEMFKRVLDSQTTEEALAIIDEYMVFVDQ